MMIFINAVNKESIFPKEYAEGFIKLLNPLCPHITEEIWNTKLGHNSTITYENWPTYDESKTLDDEIELPVQFNGKLKATVLIPMDATEEIAKEIVHNNETVCEFLEGKTVVKEIYVKNRIYNIVVR